MRVVLDTNVLVSALLKAGSVPDRLLSALWTRGEIVLYDARIVEEYRTVLQRPKFRAIDRAKLDELLALVLQGERVREVAAWSGAMKDEDDRVFVEVALAGHADAIVTGNLKDYPLGLGFDVHPPATLLALLG